MSRRIRTLKPEIIEDEKVAPLSDTAFRLFASLITLADDYGNVRADVRWLQAQVWWAHAEPPNVLVAMLELTRAGLIEVYGVRGGTYAHLNGWDKHQRIDNAGKSKVPTPNDADAQPIGPDKGGNGESSPRLAATRREPGSRDPGSPLDMDRIGIGSDMELAAISPRTKPKAAAHVLPADWSPRSDERERAVGAGLDVDAEAEHFRDHHAARGNRFTDWDAAFRTWLRNATKFRRDQPQAAQPSQPYRRVDEL